MVGMGASRCSIVKPMKIRVRKGTLRECLCPKCSNVALLMPKRKDVYQCTVCCVRFKLFGQANVKVTRK